MSSPDERPAETVGSRLPELAVAGVLLAVALAVISDSVRLGFGWADDGPASGYFPFYIGLALAGASISVIAGQLMSLKRRSPAFAERSQLVLVVSMLVPMIVFVGLVATIGIYVAGMVLIGYFMMRHGRYGIAATAAVAVGVPLVFFLVFERWFLVPLPKGPLETMLGF